MSEIAFVPLRSTPPPDAVLAVDGRKQLVGLTAAEIGEYLAELGEPRFRAQQLFEWIYRHGVKSFDAMTNLPAPLRARLQEKALLAAVSEDVEQHAVRTRTTKFLFTLADGQKVESVLMAHDYGNSVCITTQVGCRMGCTFCASTIGGFVRNLSAGEIVDQIIVAGRHLPAGERIGSVVLMGSGEPLENYGEVLKAVRLMHDPKGLGIGYRHITLSTSGLVPAMRQLAAEGLPITLALSLHAPNDELRSKLMPVNKIWPVAEVIEAARSYAETTGRRVTYEYILIADVTDTEPLAHELAQLIRSHLAHVNLIPMNPVAERPQFRRPSPERLLRFKEILESYGLATTVRREMGGEIDAACGQLRNRLQRRRGATRS
jgi:23S rRNA (adenine2503-C2)-methyltransferase